ncbi:pyrimidine dimer DNA glycosylase/endonuclease V [Microbacterium karelineae]|uniref:pyrimidine dimer DNA glycosylase/endonuclease V n=1 Tax=Microbacterium karelineae TaxID=2654283 RepID=UPI0012EADE74|nr:pyrimidine dimer DNA glycosylase/endonuclease V [Microbacterium karelineae]
MRLWSLHPRHLDRIGLVAAWREALLAQAVIADPERGYSHHPQLIRFREAEEPARAIGDFLLAIVDEADARGYRFARDKIRETGSLAPLTITTGQLGYEWTHLTRKLRRRSPDVWGRWRDLSAPDPHPIFSVVDGPIADWEKSDPGSSSSARS